MAIATLPDIPPDFGAEPTPVANVDEVQFGDGYKQRSLAGVNARRTDWRVTWTELDRAEYDALYPFLFERLKTTPFWWVPPWETAPRKFVCVSLSGPRPTSALYATITATFEEDFTP